MSLRILSWNIENLSKYIEPNALPDFVEAMGRPEVLCLQEVRVRPSDAPLVQAMRTALPGYACHHSLARDPKNVTFRGGRMYGVVTYVKSTLETVQHEVPWDREGRVVVSLLPALSLAVVDVYAVNGTDKPFWDHDLGRFEGDRHQWKRRFVERLAEECLALRAARGRDGALDFVLIGDWNISRAAIDTHPRLRTEEPHATARALFNERFLPSLDVVDAFRELHPAAQKYTWWNRRARRLDAARVDFALVSRALLPRVVEADIDERPEARLASDHSPLWLTLAT